MKDIKGCIPSEIEEALEFLKHNSGVRIIAGGTDVMARAASGFKIFDAAVLDISAIKSLSYIREKDGKIKIGAGTVHDMLANSELLKNRLSILSSAASVIGSPQIRNRGTIGGNICNASPVADLLPSLYVLNAVLTLKSWRGERELPLNEFIKAPGKTVLNSDEILTEISADIPDQDEKCVYMRSSTRKALAISKSSVAFRAHVSADGCFSGVRIALGSVGPVVLRAYESEKLFEGNKITEDTLSKIDESVMKDCTPIDDIRSTKEYRAHAIAVFLRRIVSGENNWN